MDACEAKRDARHIAIWRSLRDVKAAVDSLITLADEIENGPQPAITTVEAPPTLLTLNGLLTDAERLLIEIRNQLQDQTARLRALLF